jgi:hypothetical protein
LPHHQRRVYSINQREDSVEVNYVLMMEDFKAYLCHMYLHAPQFRMVRWLRWVLLIPVILVLVLALLAALVLDTKEQDFSLTLVGACIGTTALVFFWPQFIRWRLSKSLSRNDQRKLLSPRKLVINPISFDFTSDDATSSIRWSAIDRIEASERHAFVFVSSNVAHIIPRRAFASESAYEDFVEESVHYLEEAKASAKPGGSSKGRDTASKWKTNADDAFRSKDSDEQIRSPKTFDNP